MDFISIAIAGKLMDLYSNQDEFLSFPLGKVAFTNKSLDFMKSDSPTGVTELEKLNYKADFSRIVNIIPQDDILFDLDTSRFVWDEYIQCLNFSNFAKSSLTKEEEDKLNIAINFLGRNKPSLDVLKYLQYRNIFNEADKAYNQAKLSVELSTGNEEIILRKHWEAYLERELWEAREQAENDWINRGQKRIVENYQAIRNSLELRKYESAGKYLEEVRISEFLDTNGQGASIYSTLYSPTNIIESPWNKMTVTPSEIKSYFEKATDEIKKLFTANDSSSMDNLTSITLDYNYISVIRPWFRSSFFEMRNWKLTDDTVISDGNIPRSGKLPGYITGLILVKNINYQYINDLGTSGNTVLSILGERPLLDIIRDIKTEIPNKAVPVAGTNGSPDPGFIDPLPPINFRDVVIRPINIRPIDISVLLRPGYRDGDIGLGRPILRPEAIVEDNNDPDMLPEDLALESVSSANFSVDEGVFVIAFVCQRIPKAPNPDNSLTW
ncbi:hypothetical protein [Paenibacillus sp. IHBB 3054]|uniref:hypothetical protein n=1 Tax=Paenibacillus sp. IHBB 3054 TaxID=3425689 RepID=UPI003F661451